MYRVYRRILRLVKGRMGDEELRADARANRDRILDVARDLLMGDPEASLNSVAKAAGVGAGTLYRHFPNREALVLALYQKEIATLAALAPTLLAKHSPVRAFQAWCEKLVRFGKMKYGVADIVHASTSAEERREHYGPMLHAVRQMIEACEQSGDVHPSTDPEDVLVFLGLLWRIPPTSSGEERIKRLLQLLFRGLGINQV